MKGPVTRYSVSFNVAADHLTLEPAPDGVRHGNLEVTLLGYDRDGKPLNWMVRMLELTLPPDRYAVAQAKGVSFNLELTYPRQPSTCALASTIKARARPGRWRFRWLP